MKIKVKEAQASYE